MASAARFREMTEGWNKWQIGLVAGVGALGVAGLWFYMRRKKQVTVDEFEGIDSNQNANLKTASAKPKSPLEQALEAKKEGNVLFKNGKYNEAVLKYTEAIRLCPAEHTADIATFFQNRAAAYEQLGDTERVILDCDEAINLNKRYPKALIRRGRAHEAKENYSKALEDCTAACLIEKFQNTGNLQFADRVLKQLGRIEAKRIYNSRTPTLPSPFFMKNYFAGFCNDPVFKTLNAGKATAAATKKSQVETTQEPVVNGVAEEAAKQSPYEQAAALLARQEYANLAKLCTEELEIPDSPNRAQALLMRGTMYILYGQGQEAIKDFTSIIEMADVDTKIRTSALIKNGSLLMQADVKDEALRCFEVAQAADPQNSDVYHHRGQQLLLVDKLDEAVKDFEKSISLSPEFPTSYVQKAYAEHRIAIVRQSPMELMKADATFRAALEKFPNCSDVHLLYGQAQCDQGQLTKAEEMFSKAEGLEPDNANIIVHRGLLCLQTSRDIDRAVSIVRRAIEVDPLCEYAYEILGTIEVQRADMQAAQRYFEKAVELSKSEAEMAHICSLLHAAKTQTRIAQNLGIEVPSDLA